MINVDISNLWTCLSLPQLLGCEQEIFDAHNRLRDNEPDGPDFMAWLGQPDSVTGRLIHSIRRRADHIKDTSRVLVVCGTGSIWRGAKAAVELWGGTSETNIIFVGDSVSSRQWLELTRLLENRDMSLLIISDDGQALGPNLASRGLRWLMERKYGQSAKERICVATVVGSCLHRMAQEEDYELFPLPKQAGGTGSVLTAAALIPMAVAGMDPVDVLEGAVEGYKSMDVRSFENPAWLYAAARHVLSGKGRTRELMCYTDKSFDSFCRWWQYHAWRHESGVRPDAVLLPEGMRALDALAQSDPAVFETVLWFEPSTRKIPVEMDWKDYDAATICKRVTDKVQPGSIVLFHNAALHRHNGRALCAHHIVTQVLASKAEAAAVAEIIAVAVAIAGRNGRKRLQPIGSNPPAILFNAVTAKKAPQNGAVGLVIVVIIFIKIAQQFFRGIISQQVACRFLHSGKSAFSAGAAACQRQGIHPADVLFLVKGLDIHIHCIFEGFIRNLKIHPLDGFFCSCRNSQQAQNHYTKKNPPHTSSPLKARM